MPAILQPLDNVPLDAHFCEITVIKFTNCEFESTDLMVKCSRH